MSSESAMSMRLRSLCDAVYDEIATQDQLRELHAFVRSNEHARDSYLAYCQLHIDLHFATRSQRSHKAVRKIIFAETGEAAGPAPTFPAILPDLPTASFLGYSGWTISYLSAAVITGLIVLGFWLIPAPDLKQAAKSVLPSKPSVVAEPKAYVGRITGMVDCRIGDSRVSLGQKYALASGLMEITYDTGVKVILQGPVTYEVRANGGFLSVGKLTARVENSGERREERGEKAANHKSEILNHKSPNPQSLIPNPLLSTNHYPLFTVRTPTAMVTDLGTEFGVVVDDSGSTESHVFRGTIRVEQTSASADGSGEGRAVVVRENEAVRVERASAAGSGLRIVALRGSAKSAQFIRHLTPAEPPSPVRVLAHFRLGEDDPQAAAGRPACEKTVNHGHTQSLKRYGSPTYTGDTAASGSSLAVRFTGADDEFFYSPNLTITPNDYFILEAWVRLDRLGPGVKYVAYNGQLRENGYGLVVADNAWACFIGGVGLGGGGKKCELGRWTHVALVCERGNLQLWVNGRPDGWTRELAPNGPNGPFAIGGNMQDSAGSFPGEIDEVRLSEFVGPFRPEMLLLAAAPGSPPAPDAAGAAEVAKPKPVEGTGRQGAPSAATMYDDFPGDSLNDGGSNKWTVMSELSGVPSVAGSAVTLRGAGIVSTGTWDVGNTVSFTMGGGIAGRTCVFGLESGSNQFAYVRNDLISKLDGTPAWVFWVRDEATGAVYQSDNLSHAPAAGDVYSIAYRADSISLAINGKVVATDTSVLLSGPKRAKILSQVPSSTLTVEAVSVGAAEPAEPAPGAPKPADEADVRPVEGREPVSEEAK